MKYILLVIATLLLSSCAAHRQVNEDLRFPSVPENWQVNETGLNVDDNWLSQYGQPQLSRLVEEALVNNQNLRQSAYNVEISQQQLVQSGADLLPTLDLDLSTERNKRTEPGTISNSSAISLDANYEIDIWGKLSDAQKQANLNFLTSKAQYQQLRLELVAEVVKGWFNLVAANQLSALFKSRVDNASENLAIIESSYQQGTKTALDVYLSRNELNSEVSNLAAQQANVLEASRILERLLGRYPGAEYTPDQSELPILDTQIPTGIPSEIITRKPELLASWYQVLALDAALAFTHKQRFPSITMRASISDSQNELSDLLSGSSLGWSLLGSITAPLFRAGELKANEEIAGLQLKQQEQSYLDTLYSAFSEIENALTNSDSLTTQYQSTLAAQENAKAAETLAFEQYQRGLVTYTTVLEAQGRSFDAQSALIQIKNQLLANRVDIHTALGANFDNGNYESRERLINE